MARKSRTNGTLSRPYVGAKAHRQLVWLAKQSGRTLQAELGHLIADAYERARGKKE